MIRPPFTSSMARNMRRGSPTTTGLQAFRTSALRQGAGHDFGADAGGVAHGDGNGGLAHTLPPLSSNDRHGANRRSGRALDSQRNPDELEPVHRDRLEVA